MMADGRTKYSIAMKRVRSHWLICAGSILTAGVCVCLSGMLLIGFGIAWLSNFGIKGQATEGNPSTLTQEVDSAYHGLQEITSDIEETYLNLERTKVPINHPLELARRFKGEIANPLPLAAPLDLQIGDRKEFWVSNADLNEYFQISARLEFITSHAYFWIEEGLNFDPESLANLALKFEEQIYPTNRRFFGSEWTPGVDGDSHIYILYARNLGVNMLGYFSSSDEIPPLTHPYSNGHEMFVLNADNLDLTEEDTLSVLAHEFQHMIHWNEDRNEATWVNEGLSELAILLNGMSPVSARSFIRDTDIQLNDWPDDLGRKQPHYGAAFLFMTYFYDRFGADALRALVAEAEDGLQGIEKVLGSVDADGSAEQRTSLEDFFLDWAITLYVQDSNVGDGRYAYQSYSDVPRADETETIAVCPVPGRDREVSQFGIDYIRITCPGKHKLRFEGLTLTKVVPIEPYSGQYAFWSNRGDESDMTLTRFFDFSGYQGRLTLTYHTWFDLEKDYDYVYVTVSEDGERWQILETPSGTPENPVGNSFGWGYSGKSSGWIEEKVDLSEFSGKRIWIRFEYVTDSAVNGEGMLLDDIAIQEVGYFTDFESDDGGWFAEGWVRMRNILPQEFLLALLTFGDKVEVTTLQLSPENTIEVPIDLKDRDDEAVLVVAGAARFTRQKAGYWYEIQP